MGLAREGQDLARYLVRGGAQVVATDRKPAGELTDALAALAGLPVEFALGGHDPSLLEGAAAVFASPGVPQDSAFLAEARRRGIPVRSATALFFARCPAPIAGITGSSGKTTTTSLVGAMCSRAGRPTVVGGNIGVPLLNRLVEISPEYQVVLELSSFQLETCERSPQVAAILNIRPNHLDRHGTFERYAEAKRTILRFQRPGDRAVLNWDDPTCRGFGDDRSCWFSMVERPPRGAWLEGDTLWLSAGAGRAHTICRRQELALRGDHNVANVLAASAVADACGVPLEAIAAVAREFRGVRHRLEPIATIDGVAYYNDSIATSPERAVAGLRAFREPVVLIAGGRDKHLPLEEWAATVAERARAVVMIGEATQSFTDALRLVAPSTLPIVEADTMARAVARARALAQPGDVVLLSPGGTSFDWYRDFEERGDDFARIVRQIAAGE